MVSSFLANKVVVTSKNNIIKKIGRNNKVKGVKLAIPFISMLKITVSDFLVSKLVTISKGSIIKEVGNSDNNEVDVANIRSLQSKMVISKKHSTVENTRDEISYI